MDMREKYFLWATNTTKQPLSQITWRQNLVREREREREGNGKKERNQNLASQTSPGC